MFSTIRYLVITALLCSVVSSGSVDTAGVSAKFSHSSRVRLLGEDAFKVDFEFSYYFEDAYGVSPELFKNRFMNATKLISESIFIYSTININVVFKFYGVDSEILASCSWNELGTRNDGKKQYLSHPLALIKQSPSFQSSSAPALDMILTINLNNFYYFWFGKKPIHTGMVDFRLTIAHEIIHGLGFTDSTMNWEIEAKEEEAPLLAKRPRMNIDDKCFYRTNVFTHYLARLTNDGEYIRFPELINRIVIDSEDKNSDEYLKGMEVSKQALEAAKFLYQISKATLFEDKSGKRIYISKEGTHISNENDDENSSDFLMFARAKKGVTVESRLNEFKLQSIIGPNVKVILETLGWRFDGNEYDKITIDKREKSMCATDADGNIITFKD